MKRNYFFQTVALFAITILMLTSCHQKAEQKDNRTQFEQYLTNTDSIQVVELINTFFKYAEEENYAEAAAMLYKVDPQHVSNAPELLDNEEMAEIVTLLRTLKIYDHRIDYIKFNEYYLNEAKCTAILFPAQNGLPEASTTFYFKPVDYIDSWVLCLMHSATGDDTFVSEDEKAQLTREYQADQQARAEKQAQAEKEANGQQQDEQPE